MTTYKIYIKKNFKYLIIIILVSILFWLTIVEFNVIGNRFQYKIICPSPSEQLKTNKLEENTKYDKRLVESLTYKDQNENLEAIELNSKITRKKYEVDCQKIIEWDDTEILKGKKILDNLRNKSKSPNYDIPLLPDKNFIFNLSMCDSYRQIRGYNDYKVSEFEYKFPLAFTILTYENVEQFERLFRSIYRPHNAYCIHVDAKSPKEFHDAIKSISDCFENVFIATKLEKIVYAGFSRLQADINCMKDLVEFNKSHPNLAKKNYTTEWKYLMNLASTEFPLKTNYEIARILNIYNGANDIEVLLKFDRNRVLYSWTVNQGRLVNSKKPKTPPPHNFTIVKGITYASFSRKFVDFVLHNKYAKDLLEWGRDTYSPDEWYWATLQHNIQFDPPGGFQDLKQGLMSTRSKFVGWKGLYNCMGKFRHEVCIFSLEDLPQIVTRLEFISNKFVLEYDPITYQCVEEWYYNRVSYNQTINSIYYCRLPHVKKYSNHKKCAGVI